MLIVVYLLNPSNQLKIATLGVYRPKQRQKRMTSDEQQQEQPQQLLPNPLELIGSARCVAI
jgi:hypothetical protein